MAVSHYELDRGLEVLSEQLHGDRYAISKRRVAVMEFVPLSGEVGSLGAFFGEEIYTRSANNGVKLKVPKMIN